LYYLFHPESVVIMAETQKIIASLLQQRTPVSFTARTQHASNHPERRKRFRPAVGSRHDPLRKRYTV
jgi:hypothetical protein